MQAESMTRGAAHEVKQAQSTTCCIVGGGPAGALLALLLARQGIEVSLLEAHMDFEREFRGDTIHPATMEIMDELGLAERLLQLRHAELRQFVLQDGAQAVTVADLTGLKTKYPYVTVIAQARFLEFLTEEAKRYPDFHLIMGAQMDELIEEDGVVRGVRYRGQDGWYELRAALTVGADGRFSRVRKLAGFEPIKTAPPIDILWFRLSRREDDHATGLGGHIGNKALVPLIDRFDYWQAGYIIPKGGYQELRAAGLEHLRQSFAQVVPELADRVDELKEWKQISVLSIESSRLRRWYRPGLLVIGDAAHVMSPVGGVGINYAIQDAVVVSNVLGAKLKSGSVQERDLARVQRQRELPVRVIQVFQALLQKQVLARVINSDQPFVVSPMTRRILGLPVLRTFAARLIAFGLWPAHLKQ